MDALFDSRGKHIATVVNRQLYNVKGRWIGQYLPQYGAAIDRHGRYLGEVVNGDRLLYNLLSPYCTTSFGAHQTHEWRIENPTVEDRSPIGKQTGYIDVNPSQLTG